MGGETNHPTKHIILPKKWSSQGSEWWGNKPSHKSSFLTKKQRRRARSGGERNHPTKIIILPKKWSSEGSEWWDNKSPKKHLILLKKWSAEGSEWWDNKSPEKHLIPLKKWPSEALGAVRAGHSIFYHNLISDTWRRPDSARGERIGGRSIERPGGAAVRHAKAQHGMYRHLGWRSSQMGPLRPVLAR